MYKCILLLIKKYYEYYSISGLNHQSILDGNVPKLPNFHRHKDDDNKNKKSCTDKCHHS